MLSLFGAHKPRGSGVAPINKGCGRCAQDVLFPYINPECLATAELLWLIAYDKRHRLPCFQRRFKALLGLIDADLEVTAAPLKAETEAAPIRRQLRIDGYAVILQGHSCETEDGHQPDPAQSRNVHATINRCMGIREINRRGLPKVA